MIKAIIFDCFGVLASDGWLPFKAKYFASDPALLEQSIVLNKNVDAGVISYDNFITSVANLAHVSEDEARSTIKHNVRNDALFDYIRDQLKPSYKIGLLSNAAEDRLAEMFRTDQVALFDATVLSFQIGAIKPDPMTYQTIAERLGVDVSECIFIDDQPKYCEGATQAGMVAIHYQGLSPLKLELNQLFT